MIATLFYSLYTLKTKNVRRKQSGNKGGGEAGQDDLEGLLLRLVRSLRHPRGNVERQGEDADLQGLHAPQQAPVQEQGGAGRRMRNRFELGVFVDFLYGS